MLPVLENCTWFIEMAWYNRRVWYNRKKKSAFYGSEGERGGLLSLDVVDEPESKASQTCAQYEELM